MKTVTFEEVDCCNCGTTFQMEEPLWEMRHKDGKTFYCPNGHGQSYTKEDDKTEVQLEKLKSRLGEVVRELSEKQTEIRKLKCELLVKKSDEPTKRPSIIQRIFKSTPINH